MIINIRSEILSFLKYQKQCIQRRPRYLLTKRVKTYLKQNPSIDIDENARREFVKFLRCHLVDAFNYSCMSKYLFRKNKVLFDEKKELYYVITKEGEKLYFKKGLSKKDVSHLYNSLCAEQDTLSPHKYDFDHLSITSNVVLADIGAAKGNFSLKYIDKIKKNILIRNR